MPHQITQNRETAQKECLENENDPDVDSTNKIEKKGEYTAEPTEEMTSQDQTILDDDRNRPCIPQNDPACTPGAEVLRVDLQHILQVCQHLKQLRKSG